MLILQAKYYIIEIYFFVSEENELKKVKISSFQKIMLGFLALILLGSLLLTLPVSSKNGVRTPFDEALFTATSASCVTGLIIHDTATYWSTFGHAVILVLIQIGGLGVITMILLLFLLTGKKIGLAQRSTMQDAVSAHKVGGIVKYTKFILFTTFSMELSGALLLSFQFCPEYGFKKGLWYSFFHSISAFCNAGFDLMEGEFTSLTAYVSNPLVNVVVILLIVFGGLGFLTWQDVYEHKHKIKRYSLQSKVSLIFIAALIFLPALYLFISEYDGLSFRERTLSSLFQSVTMRTAGFNTTDLAATSEVTKVIFMGLMLIGAAPGSTAGGIKITTFAVICAAALAVFKRRDSTQMFKRRIEDSTVRHAIAVLSLYFFLFIISGFAISEIESLPLIDCLFETASAIATVGVTTGITTGLSLISKIIIIVLMFFGRVGGLTLIYATMSGARNTSSKLPTEKIIVG